MFHLCLISHKFSALIRNHKISLPLFSNTYLHELCSVMPLLSVLQIARIRDQYLMM